MTESMTDLMTRLKRELAALPDGQHDQAVALVQAAFDQHFAEADLGKPNQTEQVRTLIEITVTTFYDRRALIAVKQSEQTGERLQVGQVAIDSGMLLMADPSYWLPQAQVDEIVTRMNGRTMVAAMPMLSREDKALMRGVAAVTGWGDGIYNVYATYKDGRIAKLEVVFIEEE